MEILEKMEYITLSNGVKMPMAGLGTFLLSPDEAQESVYAALKEPSVILERLISVRGIISYFPLRKMR